MKRKIALLLIFAMLSILFTGLSDSINTKAAVPGAQEYNNHYYLIVKESRVSWSQAKQKCIDMGGHLVTITSQGEQDFIESINNNNDRLWIGGYRDSSNNWNWVTGESWSYSNWGSGEPSGGSEDSAAVWPQKWNDMTSNNLGEQNGFICEWDDYSSYMNASYENSYDNGSKKEYNGHKYQIVIQDNISWQDAKQKCITMGGHLVTITSQGEQSFIESLNSNNERLWIGGYRDSSNNWNWVTGESWSYSNWGSGEPSGGSEDSAAVWPQKWNDMSSDNLWEQNGFICEWDDNNSGSNNPTPTPTVTKQPTPEPTKVVTPEPTKVVTPKPTSAAEVTSTPKPTKAPSYKNSKLSSTKETIYVGETISIELLEANGAVKWSSSKKKVATVENGVIVAKKNGKTTITAKDTVSGKSYKCKVTVKKQSISKKTLQLKVGAEATLKMKGNPNVVWKSSDEKVAKVNNGVVTALKQGKANITATIGSKKYTCKVTVTGGSVTKGTLTASTDYVKLTGKNPSQKVTITSGKSNDIYREIEDTLIVDTKWGAWYSKNKVDLTITADSAGTTIVTVYDEKTNDKIEITVEVDFSDLVEITLPKTPVTLHEYNYSRTKIEQTYTVDNIWYNVDKNYDGKCTVYMYFSGSKSYDIRGKNQSSYAIIGWKLYDQDGYVVDSGSCYAPSVCQGDKWRDAEECIYNVKPGKYKLEILSVD